MDQRRTDRVNRLVGELAHGARPLLDELLPLVYDELRELARSTMRRERPDHTLQPTALVNEALLRIFNGGGEVESHDHLLALSARAMRSVLVDHARRSAATTRCGGSSRREPLLDTVAGYETRGLDLLALDEAVVRLERLDPALARVVELLFFAGRTAAEAADILGCSSRTVERDWRTAKAYLRAALDGEAVEP